MEWLKVKEFQYDCKEIGNTQYENIKIIIPKETIESIKKKSKKLIGTKSFGVLIGNKYKDKDNVLVYIEGVMPLGNINTVSSSFIFTDKRWTKIKERIQKNNLGKEIVGWYGVRSGWEAMVTEEDQLLHQNFFNKPWQIVYLYDRKNNSANFYYWYHRRLNRCRGYYQLEDSENRKINREISAVNKFLKGAVLIVVLLLFTALYTKFIHPYAILSNNKDNISSENDSADNITEKTAYLPEQKYEKEQNEGLEALESDKKNSELLISKEDIKQPESTDVLENAEEDEKSSVNVNQNEKASIEESIESMIDSQEETTQDFEEIFKKGAVIHIIEKGDTLIGISRQYYGDSSYTSALGKINRISDYRSLRVGDYLIIPPKDEIERLK